MSARLAKASRHMPGRCDCCDVAYELRVELEANRTVMDLQHENHLRIEAENERLRADYDKLNRYATDELARLRAILGVVASCTENDNVAFGKHLCIEQARVEVARTAG